MALRDFALLVLVCLIWATNNIISKFVVADLAVPPLFYAAVRFALVAAITARWLIPAPRPRWRLIVVALLMGGGNFALLFIGLQTATASAAAVVIQLGVPITTVLSMVMLGEQVRWRRGIGIALTLLGALAVMWDPGGFVVSTGLLFVVAAAFLGSLGAVMMKQMQGVRPLQFQAWVGFASVWPLAALSLAAEPGALQAALDAGWAFVAAVVFSAVIVSVLAHTAYYGLIQRYEANLISPLTLMTPLATIGLGVALMNDPFGPRMVVGTIVALAGVLIIALRPNQVAPLLLAWRNRAQ
ncbi:DMT family transporter [Phenylobacterium sp.]|uniref:DMT family transporter n=1 Tax=Phenylobacterium sp. TaxID=1871053 RepID=UPI0019C797D6|nr:DMT family transporter [Phenylobacterium sp.]MBC7168035.1 DMT family transporter [Phenylobacterium sp.]